MKRINNRNRMKIKKRKVNTLLYKLLVNRVKKRKSRSIRVIEYYISNT